MTRGGDRSVAGNCSGLGASVCHPGTECNCPERLGYSLIGREVEMTRILADRPRGGNDSDATTESALTDLLLATAADRPERYALILPVEYDRAALSRPSSK